MYRAFNLTLDFSNEKSYQRGKNLYASDRILVEGALDQYVGKDGILDGTKMQEHWFPQIEADIFISHSYKDKDAAITLAGWLMGHFNLKAFIDSTIWGYSNDLLRSIDNGYCLNSDQQTYNYNKRNYSTSHVHMMLSTALSMMIDKTECLFFLNTPNSITALDVVEKTDSPWIYSEIATTQIVKQRIPDRLLEQESRYFSKGEMIDEQLKVSYELDLKHLTLLEKKTLAAWEKNVPYKDKFSALNALYKLAPLNNLGLLFG